MKKILIMIVAVALLLSLVACGGDKPNNDDPLNRDPGTTQGGEQGGNNNTGGNQGGIQGGEQGGNQNSGGDISGGFVDSQWPDNELTRLIPKLGFEIETVNESAKGYGIVFTNATLEGIANYAAKVKAAGFTVNPVESNRPGESYQYQATNSAGNFVSVAFVSRTGVIAIYYADPFIEDLDDNQGDSSDEWPTSGLAVLIPKLDSICVGFQNVGDELQIYCEPISVETYRSYVESVKNAGFNVNIEDNSNDLGGEMLYTFSASNSSGNSIVIYSTEAALSIVIQ